MGREVSVPKRIRYVHDLRRSWGLFYLLVFVFVFVDLSGNDVACWMIWGCLTYYLEIMRQ